MSSSFPSFPGFAGPLSLKAFLDGVFGLKVSFGNHSRQRAASLNPSREVVLPPNEAFLMVVYVARSAPSPPPSPACVSQNESGSTGKASAFANAQQPQDRWTPTRATAHTLTQSMSRAPQYAPEAKCAFPRCGLPSRVAGTSASSAHKATRRANTTTPAASWPLYANLAHRPLTAALLQHPWWVTLTACLGPAAMAFVEVFCPVVLQLEAMAGGLQVLGPVLKHLVPLSAPTIVPPPQKRQQRGRQKRVREAMQGDANGDDLPRLSKRRTVTSTTALPGHAGSEGATTTRSRNGRRHPLTNATWEAALPSTSVSRARLYSARAEDGLSTGSTDEEDQQAIDSSRPLPRGFLEALWLSLHPRSLVLVVSNALTPRKASRAAKLSVWQRPSTTHQCGDDADGNASELVLPFPYVRHVFRWVELRAPLNTPANGTASRSFDVGAHLQRVLSSVLDQCGHLDLRGAAVKHLAFLETRFQQQQQGREPWDVHRLAAPADVVVSYLRTLLAALHTPALPSVGLTSKRDCSFWGVREAACGTVLDALLATVTVWLSSGRHSAFPVSRFLDRVPVAQVPWIAGFYTSGSSSPASHKSPSAVRHARRLRSQVQQRVWLQFVLFLTQDVLPFLLRASFTVTWSSKNPNQLLFFPLSVWRWMVRREVRLTTRRAVAREGNGHPSTNEEERMTAALRRVGTSDELNERGVAAALPPSRAKKTAVLYAGVRFRPDRHKLRPIAVLRSASLRSVKAMARGTPSPYGHAGAMVRLLERLHRLTDSAVPPPVAEVLLSVRRRMRRLSVASDPQRKPQHGAPPHKAALRDALRCLVSGVEEQRVRDGLPRLSNLSHQDEYAELRSFCEDVCSTSNGDESRDAAHTSSERLDRFPVTASRPHVTLVRSDASRCYDNLPQERVLDVVRSLVSHDAYYTLTFTSVYSIAAGSQSNDGVAAVDMLTLLRRLSISRTVPCDSVAKGSLAGIPRGHIYWEEEHSQAGGHLKSSGGGPAVISGSAVRALLTEHMQRHLIVLNGQLFEQHVGILQGSPVAMLLCDHLFAEVVDAALSRILGEHAERSLLLRRVDDVLVATASPAAALRCLTAMRDGWPAAGYQSNEKKLSTTSAASSGSVPWCGLLLHSSTMEVSVEWRRMRSLLTSLRIADARVVHCGDQEPLRFTERLFSVVQLRVPPTALCRRINSKQRQLQTVYEAALLWSRLTLDKVQEALPAAHHRSVAVLLLRPLASCVARLCRLRDRHDQFLQARLSSCELCDADVRACVLASLHRTLQARLRLLLGEAASLKTRSRARARQRKQPSRGHVTLRSFWWRAAVLIDSQKRSSIAALRPDSEVLLLLSADDSHSLHGRALVSVRQCFEHHMH